MRNSASLLADWWRCLPYFFGRRNAGIVKDPSKITLGRGFTDYYHTHILPLAPHYEKDRRKAMRQFRQRLFGFTVASLLHLLFAPFFYVLRRVLLVPHSPQQRLRRYQHLWECQQPVLEYCERVKAEIYPLILQSRGEDWTYEPVGDVPISLFMSYLPMPQYTVERSRDYMRGDYKGITLESVGAELYSLKGKQNPFPKQVFSGIFLYCRLPQPVSGCAIIRPKQHRLPLLKGAPPKGLEDIGLESTAFSRHFEVWGSDQVAARRILTPSVMERITRLPALLGTDQLALSFKDNGVLFMIPQEKLFMVEPATTRQVRFLYESTQVLTTARQFCDIVDIMEFDRRTAL